MIEHNGGSMSLATTTVILTRVNVPKFLQTRWRMTNNSNKHKSENKIQVDKYWNSP